MIIATCKVCGKDKPIQNKRQICVYCVAEINKAKKRPRTKDLPEINKKPVKKKYTVKVTGERALFFEIWGEREHFCHNCKEYLGDEPKPWMFMHIRSKGAAPSLRLVKSNIKLACYYCHQAYDHRGMNKFNERTKQ